MIEAKIAILNTVIDLLHTSALRSPKIDQAVALIYEVVRELNEELAVPPKPSRWKRVVKFLTGSE